MRNATLNKFGTLQAPATNFADSQGLLGFASRPFCLFGKDLVKKSVFPYQSRVIRSRKIVPVFPSHRVRLA
jgi:hypothetical protein